MSIMIMLQQHVKDLKHCQLMLQQMTLVLHFHFPMSQLVVMNLFSIQQTGQ